MLLSSAMVAVFLRNYLKVGFKIKSKVTAAPERKLIVKLLMPLYRRMKITEVERATISEMSTSLSGFVGIAL